MNYVYKGSPIALMLMVLVVISACAPKNIAVQGYEPTVDLSGLELALSSTQYRLSTRIPK